MKFMPGTGPVNDWGTAKMRWTEECGHETEESEAEEKLLKHRDDHLYVYSEAVVPRCSVKY